jgi:hypothetical protein
MNVDYSIDRWTDIPYCRMDGWMDGWINSLYVCKTFSFPAACTLNNYLMISSRQSKLQVDPVFTFCLQFFCALGKVKKPDPNLTKHQSHNTKQITTTTQTSHFACSFFALWEKLKSQGRNKHSIPPQPRSKSHKTPNPTIRTRF